MRIGLIDVDGGKAFPNLALMKISAYYKQLGHEAEWHKKGSNYDIVFKSKVFSSSQDIPDNEIDAMFIVKGGSGYAIYTDECSIERYDKSKDRNLPYEIEHIFPDYSIYPELTKDTAYGFLSRGCPRGCSFCHVEAKEGRKSVKVADLNEFWDGQKNIILSDPNILACPEWENLLQQLIDSKAYVDFNQGLDIRLMTVKKAEMLKRIKIKGIHFAFDRYEDKDLIMPKLKEFKDATGFKRDKVGVYILTNFDTTLKQDLERIMFVRSLDFQPYVMRYNKQGLKRGHIQNALARWVNFKPLFWKYKTFDEYLRSIGRQQLLHESL